MNIELAYKYFERLEGDKQVQNYISQVNSRYILYVANEPIENFPNYTENLDEKCTHIAFAYLNCGWTFAIENRDSYATICMEKAAEILEYLYAYKQCEKVFKEYYQLISSLAYYISSQYSKSFVILEKFNEATTIGKVTKLFLTRNFKELEEFINNYYLTFYTTVRTKELEETEIYEEILIGAFTNMFHFVNEGESTSLKKSQETILDLYTLSDINNEPHMWWYFRLLFLVFMEYEEGSLWKAIPPLLDNDTKVSEFIYANLYKKTSVTELFKSQRDCLSIELLENDGFVVAMPTSSGKTKVAEVTILKTLTKFPEALCIYIAPYRSLANEIENSMSGIFNALGYKVSQLYGGYQTSHVERLMSNRCSILIVTPEKAKAMLRSSPVVKERVKLVIIDEGHLVGFQPRYITSELLIEELKITLKRNEGQLVLLSAVLPNVDDFSLWIGNDIDSKKISTWRPSTQRFGELSLEKNTVNLTWEGKTPSFNKNFVTPTLIKEERTTLSGRVFPAKYYPADKKEAIASTATKMLEIGSVLIYVGRTNMVMSQARLITKIFDEENITHEWKNKNDFLFVELACIEAFGENQEVLELLKRGIVPHSAKLPREVRQGIEKLISHDNPKIIIATSTLGQGVNIGVSTVIISNVYLDETTTVKVNDFWNLAGRAGRAFTDTEGKILFTIDRNQSAWAIGNQVRLKNKYFQYDEIEEATSGIFLLLFALFQLSKDFKIDYDLFLEILAENKDVTGERNVEEFNNASNHLLELIDDTLVSMDILHEAELLKDPSSWIDDVFRTSLAFIQTKRIKDFDEEILIDILKSRNTGVLKLIGENIEWQSIASSSVPLKASIIIEENLRELLIIVDEYINSNQTFENLLDLVAYFDIFFASLPLSKTRGIENLELTGAIREGWFNGVSIGELENFTKDARVIIDKYYSFHFTWLLNAVAQKFRIKNLINYAEVLEHVGLLAEIGVPNLKSAKIFLSGIKSRSCAIELAEQIDIDSNLSTSPKKEILNFLDDCNKGERNCSDICYKWLIFFSEESRAREKIIIKRQSFKIKDTKEVEGYLYIKKYNGDIWLCTFDYKKRICLTNASSDFNEYIEIRGVFLKKTHDDIWIISTNNPFIKIL